MQHDPFDPFGQFTPSNVNTNQPPSRPPATAPSNPLPNPSTTKKPAANYNINLNELVSDNSNSIKSFNVPIAVSTDLFLFGFLQFKSFATKFPAFNLCNKFSIDENDKFYEKTLVCGMFFVL
jgi:hypothetical protein